MKRLTIAAGALIAGGVHLTSNLHLSSPVHELILLAAGVTLFLINPKATSPEAAATATGVPLFNETAPAQKAYPAGGPTT